MEIGFYHLTQSRLEEAMPPLLVKILAAGHRIVLRVPDAERLESLNRHLWTWSRDSFLPHGSRADGFPERQPVFLSTEIENPNGADVLVLTDETGLPEIAGFARVVDMFDGNDPEAVEAARWRWRHWREAGHRLAYYQQDERGGWRRAR
jgi:DNA polymerase-3 subunit chi